MVQDPKQSPPEPSALQPSTQADPPQPPPTPPPLFDPSRSNSLSLSLLLLFCVVIGVVIMHVQFGLIFLMFVFGFLGVLSLLFVLRTFLGFQFGFLWGWFYLFFVFAFHSAKIDSETLTNSIAIVGNMVFLMTHKKKKKRFSLSMMQLIDPHPNFVFVSSFLDMVSLETISYIQSFQGNELVIMARWHGRS
jgi:hypothetical protein